MVEEGAIELATLMQSAALDPTKWERALNAVDAFVGGSGAALLSVEARGRFTPFSTNIAEMVEDYFSRGWWANDDREACLPLLQANGIVFDHEYRTVEQIVDCDYYHDFLARHDQKWFAGLGVEIGGDSWCLALQRSPALGAFSPSDMPRLRVVRALLSNSAHLARQIGQTWMSGLQHALDAMDQPAMVFDARARVMQINAAAIALMGGSIGRNQSLRLDSPLDQAAFEHMLKRALSPLRLMSANATAIVHRAGRRYGCRATSLLGQEGLIAMRAAALVVMKPIGQCAASLLKDRFRLTETEIRVAIAVADGRSVTELASDHCVAAGTIRSQLKSIFQKVDVNSQSKLVAFVHGLAAD